MAAEYEMTLNDYLAILRRRGPQMAGAFVLFLLITLAVAVGLPPVYQSTGTILIESQQIPNNLVQATVTTFADERIEVIKQRVMTRDNLLRIAEKYRLFKDERNNLTPSELIDEMRESIAIELLSANVQSRQRGRGATIAFKLSFLHRKPDVASRVANELVTLFLDENVKSRTERATETTEFLTQEADKLRVELETVENKVAAYKQQHANALPEHLDLHMSALQRTEAGLKDVERDYRSTQEELRYLDIELESAKAGVGLRAVPVAAQAVTPASELDKLRSEYVRLSALYKENHPSVRSLKRKIELLEKSEPPSSTPAPTPAPSSARPVATAETIQNLMVEKVQAKIDAANARLASLSQQQASMRAQISQLERQIIQSPQVERGLTTLMRDYENAKKKYEEVRSKQSTAQIAESLEQENKSERFSLIDPPLMPDKPVKPDRLKILLMGFFLSLGGAGGAVLALEMLNQSIRGEGALTQVMRQNPLVVIPYITTPDEISRRRGKIMLVSAIVILLLIATAALVHFLYMPLDILIFKIIARLS